MALDLNKSQKEAVEALDGPVMVIAGAGAGKTKTIVSRIINLVKKGISPVNILAITFTNKAAEEMSERTIKALGQEKNLNRPVSMDEKPLISTFHSLGVVILRENAKIAGLPRHFTIFDKDDSKKAVKEALLLEGLDPKVMEPSRVLAVISKQKGRMGKPEELMEEKNWQGKIIGKIWQGYEKILNSENALDFDDLLLKTVLLLRKNPETAEHYNNRFQYIHVDEYQDTNLAQYELLKILAGDRKNIFVVGDIDQTIYTWRGAHIKNLLNFEKDFSGAKVIILDENYRSTKNILEAANAVIQKNKIRYEKNLYTSNPEGDKIGIYPAYDEADEASFVAATANKLIGAGVRPEEIAVLYRANFQSRALEEAFLEKQIPYQVVGTRFFERKEIKDALAFIKAALDEKNISSLKRIINVPPRGIGKLTLLKILAGKKEELPAGQKKKVAEFYSLLAKIKKEAADSKPSALIKYIIKNTGMEGSLKKSEEDQERFENLMELASLASKYDSLPQEKALEKFLTDAALASDQDEIKDKVRAVRLMTVHSAKGLEFDYCFITGMEMDLFPHSKIYESGITEEEAEEERRLFYVALTRARKKIILSYASARTIFGSRKINLPSEFLSDIDDFLYTEETHPDKEIKTIYL